MNPEIELQKKWIAKQFLFEGVLEELDAHFCDMGIEYMPIKGAYLIHAGLAGKIAFRRMLDIDLLVRPQDFETVVRYFSGCDKARLHEDKWRFEQPFFYRYSGISVHVEIHNMINRPERFILPAQYLFARSVKRGKFLRMPIAEDALLVACCHALVHLGYYLHEDVFKDISVISECRGFRWDEFWKGADQTGILPFIEFLFSLHPDMGASRSDRPGYGVFPRLWAKVFKHFYAIAPSWAKRLLFELPFVRRPLGLMIQSIRESQEDQKS